MKFADIIKQKNYRLFFYVGILFIGVFAVFNLLNYYKAMNAQEELYSKKQREKVEVYASLFRENISNTIRGMETLKEEAVFKFINKEIDKKKCEEYFSSYLRNEGDFGVAYFLLENKNVQAELSYDMIASEIAINAVESRVFFKDEIYVAPFYVKNGREYMTVVFSVGDKYNLVGVFNLKYFSDIFLKTNSNDYQEFFIINKNGTVLFDYDREIIGKNVLDIHENDNSIGLKEVEKRYLTEESGRATYTIISREEEKNKIKKFTSWSSLNIGDEKLIICDSTPYSVISESVTWISVISALFFIFIVLFFILFLTVFYKYVRITHERDAEKAVRKERDKLEVLMESTKSIYWEYSEFIIDFSHNFEEIIGINYEDIMNSKIMKIESFYEEIRGDIVKIIEKQLYENKEILKFQTRIFFKETNRERWFLNSAKAVKDSNNEIRVLGIMYEITDIKKNEQKLLSFEMAVEQSSLAIVMTNLEGEINYVNKKFEKITGYMSEEVLGKNPRVLKSGAHDKEFYTNLWNRIKSGATWNGEFINRKKDGNVYYEKANISPLYSKDGKMYGYLCIKEDISKQKELEIKLEKYATRDELTGVFNRRVGFEFLEQQIKISERSKKAFVIIFIDVNNLKKINDNMGHGFGDSLIRDVCDTIQEEIRETDVISRLGGDEFLVILPKCGIMEAEIIWNRVEERIKEINNSKMREYIISVSHGAVEYISGSGVDSDILIELADKKMYEEKNIKKSGKCEWRNI